MSDFEPNANPGNRYDDEVDVSETMPDRLSAPRTASPAAASKPGRLSFANLVGGNADVSPMISMIIGAVIAFLFYLIVVNGAATGVGSFMKRYADMFVGSATYIQSAILWFFWSGIVIVFVKLLRYFEQQRVFGLNLIPAYLTRISKEEAAEMLETIPRRVNFYSTKVLARRIVEVLEHYVSGGYAESAAEVNRDRAHLDADVLETSYSFLRVLIWGIPILGFVGTVIGISNAIGEFSGFGSAITDLTVQEKLNNITSGLGVAFDTTLVALIAALILMFLVSPMQKAEEGLYNQADHIVLSRLVSKLDRAVTPPDVTATLAPGLGEEMSAAIREGIAEAVGRMADNAEAMQKTLDDNFQAFNHRFSETLTRTMERLADVGLGATDAQRIAEVVTRGLDQSFGRLVESIRESQEAALAEQKAGMSAVHEAIREERENVERFDAGVKESMQRGQAIVEQLERSLTGYIKTFVAAMSKEEKIISLQNQINSNLALLTTADNMQKTLSQLSKELDALAPAVRELAKPITLRILEEKRSD